MNDLAYTRGAALARILQERIVILDGAMGTLIQQAKLAEADYRGARFADHPKDLKGNNELLQLTRPELILRIHEDYLRAGADPTKVNRPWKVMFADRCAGQIRQFAPIVERHIPQRPTLASPKQTKRLAGNRAIRRREVLGPQHAHRACGGEFRPAQQFRGKNVQ